MSSSERSAAGRTASTADPYTRFIRSFFARWAPFYDLFARPIAWVYRAAVDQVGPRPGLRVLDLCTGTGEIARRCAAAGADVTGVDLSPEMLAVAARKLAARRLDATLELMDARRLDFPDRAFDVVVLGFCLHDMPLPVRPHVLREAARVAAGRLVVVDYDLPPGRRGSALWLRLLDWVETPYFKTFAGSGAGPLLAAAGLRTVRSRRLFPAFALFDVDLRPTGA